MAIKCCNGCAPPKRHEACWGHCPDFAAEKAEDAEKKKQEDMRRKVNNSIYQQRSDSVTKALRRHGRK